MATYILVVKRRKKYSIDNANCINTPLQNIIVFKAVKNEKKISN